MKSSHAASFWRHTHITVSFEAPQTNEILSANAIPSLGLQFKEIVNLAVKLTICGPPEFLSCVFGVDTSIYRKTCFFILPFILVLIRILHLLRLLLFILLTVF
jgi:hypothetical protein